MNQYTPQKQGLLGLSSLYSQSLEQGLSSHGYAVNV